MNARAGRLRLPARALLGALLLAAGDPLPLPPGQRLAVDVPPVDAGEASQAFTLTPAADGPLTVLAESLDGDVLVRLLDESGETLAADDDSGVEGNARLVIEAAAAGQALHLLVAFKQPAGGAVSVEAVARTVPRLEGAAAAEASGLFLLDRGRHRVARGEMLPAATDLAKAGNLLFGTQRFAAARDTYDAMIPLLEAIGDTRGVAYARAFRACALAKLGALVEARTLLEAAAADATVAGNKSVAMMVVSNLGTVCRGLGLTKEAEEHISDGLQLARETGDRGSELILLVQLAQLRLALGQSDAALATCDEADALAAKLGAPALQLEALAARAECMAGQGDLRGACARYEQALSLSPAPSRRANLLGALGDLEFRQGDVLSAASRYREAADVATAIDDSALRATATLGLGQVEWALGDPARARDACLAALTALGDGGHPANRSAALQLLALAQLDLGEYAAARASAEEARRMGKAAADPLLEARALATQAEADRVEGKDEARLLRTRECLDLLTTARRPLEAAIVQGFVAQAELRLGHVDQALEQGQLALARLTELHGERYVLHPLCTLAEAAIRRGDAAVAAGWLDQAERSVRLTAAATSDPRQLADLRSGENQHTPGQLAQDLAALRLRQAGSDRALRTQAIEAGLRSCGEWKGLALLDGLERQRGGGDDADSSRLLAERRRALADRDAAVTELVAVAAAEGPAAEQDALRTRIAGLDAEAAAASAELARLSPREAAFEAPPSWGLSELRKRLGPQDVYVEYAESGDKLYAYVVTAKTADLRDLGPRAQRASEVEAFVSGISEPAKLASAAQVVAGGSKLYRALLGDVLPAEAGPAARLIVVPSALVTQLPFEALVVEAPPKVAGFKDLVFVLDRREVIYAPSGPVLALMKQTGPRTSPGRALVLGDPVYPPADAAVPRGSRDPRSLGFVRLPGTRDEALGIAQRLIESRSPTDAPEAKDPLAEARASTDVSLDTPELRLCLGGPAAAGALRGDLREFSLIHCATHGHVDAQDPRLTGLALTPQGTDDGFVTLADVLELSLDADLAVLSACETGRGRERLGEGTQSLARAFLHAGARAVVSSLWQVDDRETERTMQEFYAGMTERGLTASAALRAARLSIRQAPAAPDAFRGVGRGQLLPGVKVPETARAGRKELAGHPFFWAAFTYVGAPDHRLQAVPVR